MNDVFNLRLLRRMSELMKRYPRTFGSLLALTLTLCMAGCNNSSDVRVQLHTRNSSSEDLLRLEVLAEVAGPQAGLRYKWFAVSGGCDPQESESPSTIFKFADNSPRDRVSVEVWRDKKVVGRSDLDVTLDEERLRVASQRVIGIKIEITNVPPYDAYGGSDTRSEIGGYVDGKSLSDCKVVIYARAGDTWYVQPMADSFLPIRPDNTWTSWTHTGSSYAALMVRPGYDPQSRMDLLPPVGGYVIGRTVVEGKRPAP